MEGALADSPIDRAVGRLFLALGGASVGAILLLKHDRCSDDVCLFLQILAFPLYMQAVGLAVTAILKPMRWLPSLSCLVATLFFDSKVVDILLTLEGAGLAIHGIDVNGRVVGCLQRWRGTRRIAEGVDFPEAMFFPFILAIMLHLTPSGE